MHREIEVSAHELALVDRYMTVEPSCAAECFGEDEPPYTLAVELHDGVTAYLQCRGVRFGKPSNTAYADVTACDADGWELDCEFEPPEAGTFTGRWHIEIGDREHIVDVVAS